MNITNITRSKNYKHKVLIVDDGNISLQVIEALVKTLRNTAVRTLVNPIEAVELAYKEPLTLIITDYYMSEMNGLELIRKIKTIELNKNVPILVITVGDDKSIHQKLMDAGADQVVLKKTKLPVLIGIVSSLLEVGKKKLVI